MNAADIFAEMTQAFQSEKAGDLQAVFQFNLSGEEGGEWAVAVANRACTVTEGQAEKPDVTISMGATDFVKMVNGQLKPLVAFMQGKIKLHGNMDLAMKVQELFVGPGS